MSKRDELAVALARVRSMAGLSGRAMADRTGTTQGTLWRIEHGKTLPTLDLVKKWLNACSAEDDTRRGVLALLEQAHTDAPSWSRRFAGRAHLQEEEAARERASTRVRNLQTCVVPGLLQTPDYARHVMRLADMTGEVDIPAAVAARMQRQVVLHEPGRRFEFLIAERVLRWAPTPGVMPAQLDRLATLDTLDTVTIGVIPAGTPLITWSPFVIHDPAGDDPVFVTVELNHGLVEVRRPSDVGIYLQRWKAFATVARGGVEARALLERIAAEYRGRTL